MLKWIILSMGIMTTLSANSVAREIYLLEVIPTNNSDYTISSEKAQISMAADIALNEFKKNKSCDVYLTKKFELGNEISLVEKIRALKAESKNRVVVGLSRSNFFRVATKVSEGSGLKIISIGAAATNTKVLNPYSITMVNPWEEQYRKVRHILSLKKCDEHSTVGYFDPGSYLSHNFMQAFIKDKLGSVEFISNKSKILPHKKCLFVGVHFSETSLLFAALKKEIRPVDVVGLGGWSIYGLELARVLKTLPRNLTITVPLGWASGISQNSKKFAQKFFKLTKVHPAPIAAYTYDAIILAAENLCHQKDFITQGMQDPRMLRVYRGKTDSGNFLSKMFTRELKGGQ